MKVAELLRTIEDFHNKVVEHRNLWNKSLAPYNPRFPVKNKAELQQQSTELLRILGWLRPLLMRYRKNWTMAVVATGQKWDALEAAVGLSAVALIKGQSLKYVIEGLNQIIGQLQQMSPDEEISAGKEEEDRESFSQNTSGALENSEAREPKWDFFICHASEDKNEVVEPLAVELKNRGVRVWYDLWTLTVGDSLSRKIDEGLVKSKFGIVILSLHFFDKHWPQKELSGLSQKEVDGQKVILPVWHNVNRDYIASHSPTLADRIAVSTSSGIHHVASEILRAGGFDSNNVKEKSNNGQQSHVADISIGFAKVQIQTHLHIYNLVVKVKLKALPDQGRLRLRFTWPAIVPIVETSNLKVNNRIIEGGIIRAREYTIDWEERIFPGEAVELLGPHSKHRLQYKFDESVWSEVEEHPYYLEYSLYFEDHPPISGLKPFKQLNVF